MYTKGTSQECRNFAHIEISLAQKGEPLINQVDDHLYRWGGFICLWEGEVGIHSTFHLGETVVLFNINPRAKTPHPYINV